MEKQYAIEESSKKLEQNERPVAITVICVLDFIGTILVIPPTTGASMLGWASG